MFFLALSWFYPDFILILSRFYPDFIQILSWPYPDLILILSWSYPDFLKTHFIQMLSRFYLNFSKNLDKIRLKLDSTPYPDFILISSRFHPDFFLILSGWNLDKIRIKWIKGHGRASRSLTLLAGGYHKFQMFVLPFFVRTTSIDLKTFESKV